MDRKISQKTIESIRSILSADILSCATVIAIAVGVFLRLYLIFDQALLDDEWHSLHYVIGKNFRYLLTHFSIPGATSIPLNVYNLALLKTTGWSEFMVRLPSIVAGIVALVFFPFLVRSLIGRRPALLFTMLLAISPFLVFYSRVARPYSMVVVFGFTSLMFGYNWLISGRRTYCVAYLLTSVLAIECHLFALPAVIAPLVIGFIFKMRRQSRPSEDVILPWKDLAISGVILAALLGFLQVPAFLDTMRTSKGAFAGRDILTLESAWNAALLWSGTANPAIVVVFTALFLHGLLVMFRRSTLAVSLFVAVFVINLALIFVSRPDSIHAAIVVSRYCIVAYPISFMLVALGLDDWLIRLRKIAALRQPVVGNILQILMVTCFVVILFCSGPLMQQYVRPNNFTNHSVFQQSYRDIAWDRSFLSEMRPRRAKTDTTIHQEEISPFYHWLQMENAANIIVEFPMMIGDHFNPYYYYQHFHGKRVLVGYDINCPQLDTSVSGNVYGDSYVDEVLNRITDRRKIRLRNMLNMSDIEELRRSGASYIVLHYRFEEEISHFAVPHPTMDALMTLYERNFGQAIYKDNRLVVYMIKII